MRYRALAIAIFLLKTMQYEWSHSFVQAREHDSSTARYNFDLLKRADKAIRLGRSHQDAVLLPGTPGAGTTTIAKILTTNCTDLEAYYSDTAEKYFIRDLSVDGSGNCEISSQLPVTMTNPEDGLTFYPLPSYEDSWCKNKTEMGRFLLFRALAKHAQSVKVLFITDYKSLFREPEYLARLVATILPLFPAVQNSSNSIGLVVTKVGSTEPDPVIINRIREFLSELKDQLSPEANHRAEFAVFGDFVASLLQDGQNGRPKIYFTRVPTRPGRLSDLPEMVQMRANLTELVARGLKSVTFSPSDINYTLNETGMDALEAVTLQILGYIGRLQERTFEPLHNTLYSDGKGYFSRLTPGQIRLVSSSRSALNLLYDHSAQIPSWVTMYVIDRTMNELEGVIIPLNSSFAVLREELEDRKNVIRAVYEILGRLPDDGELKEILHPGDEAPTSPFQPLLDFQSRFCAQLNTDTVAPCSNLPGENTSTSQLILKRRCTLRQVVCTLLNEFITLSPAASDSSKDERLSNSTMDRPEYLNVTALLPRDGTSLGSVLESVYNFTASQIIPHLNAFTREHTPNTLPPAQQIILHEFMTDLTFVQICQGTMNGAKSVSFTIMSQSLKSSIRLAKNILVPYNYSSTGLAEQLIMEQEQLLRHVRGFVGTLGEGGDAEKSNAWDENVSTLSALASLRSRLCPAFEAAVTGTVCNGTTDNGAVIDTEARQRCRVSNVICTILKELWE